MKVEEIEIHAGAVDFLFEPIRRLEAKCEATTNFSKAPTIEDVNSKLREMAAGLGANAVVNVEYKSGPTLTSWRSIRGTGLAVRRVSDEMPCPVCAEMIKRAAKKCRFCGAEIPESARQVVTPNTAAPADATQAIEQEPLKSSDNLPTAVWVLIAVVLGIIALATLSQ